MHYHLMHYWNVNCILNKVWAAFTSEGQPVIQSQTPIPFSVANQAASTVPGHVFSIQTFSATSIHIVG